MREALKYLNNAKEILKSVPIEDSTYTDIKPVQEACGTAYLAVLKAVDEYLLKKGVDEKDLPQSVEGYREMIRKYAMVHDGKLVKEFEKLYKLLHIAHRSQRPARFTACVWYFLLKRSRGLVKRCIVLLRNPQFLIIIIIINYKSCFSTQHYNRKQ